MKRYIAISLLMGCSIQSIAQDKLVVVDSRDDNHPPTYYNKEVKFEFKRRSTIGVPGTGSYSGMLTLAPWGDNSGDEHHQLNFNEGGLFYRNGLPESSTWNGWQKLVLENTDGNVGIGLSNPSEKLEVKGGSITVDASEFGSNAYEFGNNYGQMYYNASTAGETNRGIYFQEQLSDNRGFHFLNSTGTRLLDIHGNGNVGIGTTSPGGKLSIYDANQGLNILVNKKLTGTWPATAENRTITLQSTGASKGSIAFAVGNTEEMRVSSNGNIGIGTTNPQTKLDVAGSLKLSPSSSNLTRSNVDGLFVENAGSGNGYYVFQTATVGGGKSFSVTNAGNVGIGTTTPDSKLAVNGQIHTKEVKVDLNGWSDFVFKNGYDLPTLTEVENHIDKHGHLIDIPSEKEVLDKGVLLGQMDAKLLQKIEELTLYTIAQQKEIDQIKSEHLKVVQENNTLSKTVKDLEHMKKELQEIKALLKK